MKFSLLLLSAFLAFTAAGTTTNKYKATLAPEPGAYAREARGEATLTFTNNTSGGFARYGVTGVANISGLASRITTVHLHRGSPSGPIELLACGEGGPALAPRITQLTANKSFAADAPTCGSEGVSRTIAKPLKFAIVAKYGSGEASAAQARSASSRILWLC